MSLGGQIWTSEAPEGMDGWTDERTDIRTNGRTQIPPRVLQDFDPFGAAALFPFDFNKHQLK